MTIESDPEMLDKLLDEQAILKKRVELLRSASDDADGAEGSMIDHRGRLDQVERLIAEHEQGAASGAPREDGA